jgi:hypothetical protein
MANRYLKLDNTEADTIKKQFVLSETELANIQRIIQNYKISRRKETIMKNKLKIAISSLKAKINTLENTFPEEEKEEAIEKYRKAHEKRHNIKQSHEEKQEHENTEELEEENQDINPYENEKTNPYEDLEDIRTQLSRFN